MKILKYTHGDPENKTTGLGNIEAFPTDRLRVQILCEDAQGLFVAENVPFSEMLSDEVFLNGLHCLEMRRDGYNTSSSWIALFHENPIFQITEYMYTTKDFSGRKVGGYTIDNFKEVAGVRIEISRSYYGDDEKPGF